MRLPQVESVKAGDEIFDSLALVDKGFFTGAIQKFASVGIFDYQNVFASHHKLVNRRIDAHVHVHAIAADRQDFQMLLMKGLLKSDQQSMASKKETHIKWVSYGLLRSRLN